MSLEEDEYSYYTYSEYEYEGKEKKTVEVEKPRGREQSSDETVLFQPSRRTPSPVMTEQDREEGPSRSERFLPTPPRVPRSPTPPRVRRLPTPPRAPPRVPRLRPRVVLRPGPGGKGKPAVGGGKGGKGHRGKGKPAVGGEGGNRSKGKGKPAVGGEGGGGQPGGFWFGHDFQVPIEGPKVCGRYIRAKASLKRHGEHRPLLRVFHAGGDPSARKGNGDIKSQPLAASSWEDRRVHAVMGLVQLHEGEYRRWHTEWGPLPVDCNTDWQRFDGPAPLPGHLFWSHHQLQLRPVTSGIRSSLAAAREFCPMPSQYFTSSTILRKASSQPLAAAYESRNVFIVNLPEILLKRMWTHTAAEVYEQWSECEVIIGKRPRRGHSRWR